MTHFAPGPVTGSRPRAEQPPTPRTVRLLVADKPEREPDWRKRSVCANSPDINAWFPAGNTGFWAQHIEDTKALCLTCPVIARCEALLNELVQACGPIEGIWAGTSEADRTSEKRRAQREQAKSRYNEKRRAAA